MYINQSLTDQNFLRFKSDHKAELQTLIEMISKITSRTQSEVEPHLEAMIGVLVETPKQLFKQSFDPEQWAVDMKILSEGAENIPVLPSEAFTRESIYQDHD